MQDIHFRIDDTGLFDNLVAFFQDVYNNDQLKSYLLDLFPKLAGRCSVRVCGREESMDKYMPDKKPYAYRKGESAVFCALIHSHPDNLRQVLELLPEWYSEAIRLMLQDGYVSQTRLASIGAQSMIADTGRYGWGRFTTGTYCSLFGIFTSLKDSPIESMKRWETEGYILIHRSLANLYALVLLPRFCEASHYLQDESQFPVFRGEEAFHQAFPIIQGLQRQHSVQIGSMSQVCSVIPSLQIRFWSFT